MSKSKATAANDIVTAAEAELAWATPESVSDILAAAPRDDVVTLELSDLVRDTNGEIVLFNDSHLPTMAVRVETAPIESGEIGRHVTAAGDDVSGYRFVAFDNGTKLFYHMSMDLVLLDSETLPHG